MPPVATGLTIRKLKQEFQNRALFDLVSLYICHEENPFIDTLFDGNLVSSQYVVSRSRVV